jgi:hypothetical protein
MPTSAPAARAVRWTLDRLHGVRSMVDDLEISVCRMVEIDASGAACANGTETPLMFN